MTAMGLIAASRLAVMALRWDQHDRASGHVPSEYVQLTDFTDSAVAAAVSRDGRMAAFTRGGEPFLRLGQVCVKLLPNGETVRLTSNNDRKVAPTFTPERAALTGPRSAAHVWLCSRER